METRTSIVGVNKASRIVGVAGYLRTGKDSVAELLQQYGYTRVSFADPLRKMALDIDPTISLVGAPDGVLALYPSEHDDHKPRVHDAIYYSELLGAVGYERAKEVPDFRRFLQRLGTEGVRGNFGQDAWVKLAEKEILRITAEVGRVVLPDVRFPNEAKAIKDLGGVIWKTIRPGYGGGEHPSEAMVDQITPDLELEADNLIELGRQVLEAMGEGTSNCDSILQPWSDKILARA